MPRDHELGGIDDSFLLIITFTAVHIGLQVDDFFLCQVMVLLHELLRLILLGLRLGETLLFNSWLRWEHVVD